jgi:hypothetical protein
VIINGKEWRLVPVEATKEMLRACEDKHSDRYVALGTALDYYTEMIAAAPAPPVVDVTDDVARQIANEYYGGAPVNAPEVAGQHMIAAVQSILGPTLGMISREEHAAAVEAAYREGTHQLCGDWPESEARKRLEAK